MVGRENEYRSYIRRSLNRHVLCRAVAEVSEILGTRLGAQSLRGEVSILGENVWPKVG
jgi:hypothetical protein